MVTYRLIASSSIGRRRLGACSVLIDAQSSASNDYKLFRLRWRIQLKVDS